MVKKTRVSKKKIIRVVLVFCAIVVVGGYFVSKQLKGKEEKVKQVVKIEEKIEGYNYELSENETDYYKGLFKNLKSVLSEDEIDEEKYASLVSQLFLADFFNLDNKLSKNDVGGVQFIYNDFRDDFSKLAKESIYHYVESDIYKERKQELPVVKEVSVLNIDRVEWTYLKNKVDKEAYQIDLKISYEEDMGYQENATLVLVHNDETLDMINRSA